MQAVTIHSPGEPPETRELDVPVRAGGSKADEIHLASCPPGALRLVPCAAGVVAEPVAVGVRVGGRTVPPGARRLLRAGERLEVHDASIVVAPRTDEGTRAAAGALLREAVGGGAPSAGPHLVVLSGPAAGSRHPLVREQTLGRGRAATIAIPDPRASRVHARIRLGAGGATVEDLRSKNGVRVNGVPIERRPFPLRPGDELTIGETSLAIVDVAGGVSPHRPERPRRPPPRVLAAALLALSAAALALAAGQAGRGDSAERSSSVSNSSR